MPDREKVIKALECCRYVETWSFHNCEICPYKEAGHGVVGCEDQLVSDALDLLKEQEARVMSLKEARETLHTAEFLYCEDKNDDTMAGGLMRGVLNGSDYWDLSNGEYMTPDCLDEGGDLEAEYGKYFRFWTAKPSPEQMRYTPWEGDSDAE